ncbi:Conserved oligomeric Golgi complex subunit 6 [Sparassis crispa]|uniref:Conserved oligomeric Golgi complex subunit 6 n=1 Tax=Sparassis crispa TaxID=139825 RepID=A0A401GIE9_9APHY|nr:Conserved oligomeric Golgi complex subunit 6 [Sparassis crispa]GBE81891.1 Conserved oligomeric Golgi complex subunit 6 [Sparassis crispa]
MTAVSSSSRLNVNSPQPQNIISLRLYKVLGASFDDDATKEALRTVAELYAPPVPTVSVKGKEVQRELDDADEGEGVKVQARSQLDGTPLVEVVPGEIAARARKNLRRDVESKLAESSRKFLDAFGEVDKQLDTLQEHIAAMRMRCDEGQAQLRLTSEACGSLLDRAGSLREERQAVATRQSIVSLFLSRFTLNDEEKEAISSRDVPVGMRFFDAMDKADRIRDDCRVLMAGEEGPTKAGLDIMAATATYLEQAHEKVFRWCCSEFRHMGRDAQLEVSPVMREAVRRLRQRPELLTEALGYLSQTRQATVLAAFTGALTRGGPGGLPRPIELHAHDPLRYVGDMLAWVHQAIAAEHEFLESLFGVRADGRMVGSVRQFGDSVEEELISELMNAAVGKLCTPLKVRVQQTVRSQESSITLYKIANLLKFYTLTMERTIGEHALLSEALKQMTDMSFDAFLDNIEAQSRALIHIPLGPDDKELTPPLVILDHAQVLREIMIVYASSLQSDEPKDTLHPGFRQILDKMVDPAVEMCISAAEVKKKAMPWWDRSVFVLNCLAYMQSLLEPFPFTKEKQAVIHELMDHKILQLTEEHYKNILWEAGFNEVVEAFTQQKPGEPLSYIYGTTIYRLQSALRKFSTWLSGITVVHSNRLSHLTVQSHATRVHQAVLVRIARIYERLIGEMRKPENKYEAAATLLAGERPFGQMHLLWQIFGMQDQAFALEGQTEPGDHVGLEKQRV